MKTIQQQKEALGVLFGAKPVAQKEEPETTQFVIPRWNSVAETYPEAVQKVLDAIKVSRPFYNWEEGNIDAEHLRETKEKKAAIAKLPIVDEKYIVIDAQMGKKWKGKSVKEVRANYAKGEFGLGAYEVACILLTHPGLLSKYEDLWIDCPGDEFHSDEREFSRSPFLFFSGGRLGFGTKGVSYAYDSYGSASAFLPQ